ncbi:class F sortase [Kribbella sp. HUAS MG21]|uniref:Class F sortase n=1 Tax=Kribbella sp. HUAS MG21 TaxID=3160966 RepID=A0AAU7TGD8_9ACTN
MTAVRRAAVLAAAALPALVLFTGCGNAERRTAAEPEPRQPTATTLRPAASPNPADTAPATIRTRDAGLPPVAPVPRPNRLQIDSAQLDLQVEAVGVAADGQMELPPNPSVVGWYKFGPAPVDGKGSVVLGGHLDSKEWGAGPLVKLRAVRPGDTLALRSTDGTVTRYRVRTVEVIPKSRLAVSELFDRDGPSRLRLVTCGGPYDRNGGGYRDNVVLTAAAF